MLRVLLIEDDEKLGSYLEKGLRQEGYNVAWVRDGLTGADELLHGSFAAAVVDVMLPRLDGRELVARARRRGCTTPILMLSARSEVDDRVSGLGAGADDYMIKPFSFVELVARLEALLRRAEPARPTTELAYADLHVDLLSRKVRRGGRELDLQPKEFALLEYLLRNQERVVSKTMILEHVWDYTFDPQTNVVDVLVSRLRKKVDRDGESKLIHTIRGVGYVLRLDG